MHARSSPLVLLGALALTAGTGAPRAFAQSDAPSVAQMCINRLGIDHTRVLDDSNILFFMHNHTKYRNTLVGSCPGLRTENHFAYGQDLASNLCKGNVIRVLDYSFGAASLGASCWLGMFQPLSDDEVEGLVAAASPKGKRRDASQRAVTVEPVELPAAPAKPAPADTPTEHAPTPNGAEAAPEPAR